MAIKAVVLDFDGVLVESNNIKHQAFSDIFSEFSDHYKEIMAYHFAHNAVNRYDKFEYIMKNILRQEYDRTLAKRWALRFSELTRDKIINCPYVKGASDFVKHFSNKFPLYVASATPFDELNLILNRRGILQYFKGVYGAPTQKMKIFKDIAKKERVKPKNILYIGDSLEDYEVANDFGCTFIARTSDYDFKGIATKSFKNMSEIESYILSCLIK